MSALSFLRLTLLSCVVLFANCAHAYPETMDSMLEVVDRNNPQLNAKRASLRATQELICQAEAGLKPNVNIVASAAYEYYSVISLYQVIVFGRPFGFQSLYKSPDLNEGASLNVSQTLFDGSQTLNRVEAAKHLVRSTRELLRSLEQAILLSAVTAYMDVLRESANLTVQRSNVLALRQLTRQLHDRMRVQDTTRTDVAQAEAKLASAEADVSKAEATLTSTTAEYRRIVGAEPVHLLPASPIDRLLPKSLPVALETGLRRNPDIGAVWFSARSANSQIKIAEGQLLPIASLQASLQQGHFDNWMTRQEWLFASLIGQVTIPVFQGGGEYAAVRQNKETYAQKVYNLRDVRDQTIASITDAWSQASIAKSQIVSSEMQIGAARIALDGVRGEINLRFRTTVDLLNAQQDLVNAYLQLLNAQHDRVVSSYNLMSAIGGLAVWTGQLPVGSTESFIACDNRFEQ